MKSKLLATLLATAIGASFATVATAADNDAATYRNATQKAAADYKSATAKCTSMGGNAKQVCTEEAKVARARAEAEAVAQHNNTSKGRAKAWTKVADADYSLAKVKCGAMTGAEKDSCMNNAKSVHTAAVADAKADRVNMVASTGTTDATKAAAADKCAQVAGSPNTGCLIDNKTVTPSGATTASAGVIANRTGAAAGNAADKTRDAAVTAADKTRSAAATVVEKTRDVAASAVEKTRQVASTAAEKTRDAVGTAAVRTDRATDNMDGKAEVAAAKTGAVVADSVITTKVKADLFKQPELKSMAIHVETEKGVVMLSGFVDSKADADKAVKLAKSVEGVTSVKSAIKVK